MADYAYALHAPAIGFALVVMSDFSDSASACRIGWRTKGCAVGMELQSAVDPACRQGFCYDCGSCRLLPLARIAKTADSHARLAECGMSICLRRLQSNELDWANQRYSEVDFLPSAPSDLIVIATVEGQPAGLGRVSLLQPGVGELGGMVVFPAYRGRGIARLLIEWLIAESGLPTLYCLPFEDLAELYRSCGFALHEASSVPDKLRAKYTWCNNHYARRVLLMARQSATSS